MDAGKLYLETRQRSHKTQTFVHHEFHQSMTSADQRTTLLALGCGRNDAPTIEHVCGHVRRINELEPLTQPRCGLPHAH